MHSKVKKIGHSMKNEMETFRNVINRKNLEISKLISDQLAEHEQAIIDIQALCDLRVKEIRDEEGSKKRDSKSIDAKFKELELLSNRQTSALRFFNLQMFVSFI